MSGANQVGRDWTGVTFAVGAPDLRLVVLVTGVTLTALGNAPTAICGVNQFVEGSHYWG